MTLTSVSVFNMFQRLLCKSLQVASKVLVLVLLLVAPVLVNIIAGDIRADRQTDAETDIRAHHNTALRYRGRAITEEL